MDFKVKYKYSTLSNLLILKIFEAASHLSNIEKYEKSFKTEIISLMLSCDMWWAKLYGEQDSTICSG